MRKIFILVAAAAALTTAACNTIAPRASARAMPGARLAIIDGMGHDLPRQLWDEILGELGSNFARV